MSDTAVLVVAKAPVPGLVKTRLAASVGDQNAAELAAAALLDTLETCAATFQTRLVAITGDLDAATDRARIAASLRGWEVFEQRGRTFADRLVNAHADATRRTRLPVVQVGMDTPQLSVEQLNDLATALTDGRHDAVLGPADDGGWWALGVDDVALLDGLETAPMSSPRTGVETLRILDQNDARVWVGEPLRDIDELDDAEHVSARFPGLRFSVAWRALASPSSTEVRHDTA